MLSTVKFVNGMQSCSLSITLQSRIMVCACDVDANDAGRWPVWQGTNQRTGAFYRTIPETKPTFSQRLKCIIC